MRLLAVDPGISSGYALYDGNKLEFGVVELWHGLDALIDRFKPDVVIVENFRLFPHMAKSLANNTFLTVRVIGVVQYICELRGIKLIEQEPSVKMGYPIRKPREMAEHAKDSVQHIIHYLMQHGEPLGALAGFIKEKCDKVNKEWEGQISDFQPESDPFQVKILVGCARRKTGGKRSKRSA